MRSDASLVAADLAAVDGFVEFSAGKWSSWRGSHQLQDGIFGWCELNNLLTYRNAVFIKIHGHFAKLTFARSVLFADNPNRSTHDGFNAGFKLKRIEWFRDEIVGLAEVREVFRSPKFGDVAGCLVVDGFVKRNNPIRVLRENVVIYEGELESLRRFKDDVAEVRAGTECGIAVKNYDDVRPGDQIECYERVEIARTA